MPSHPFTSWIGPDFTGYEPIKKVVVFAPETFHIRCVDSTMESGCCRVFPGGGGYSLKFLMGGVTAGSPISWSPISKPKHDSFLTCFQTWFLTVLLSFVHQLPSNVKIWLKSVRIIYFVYFSFFCIHLELFGVEKINKFIQCRGFLENHTQF